MPSRKQRRRRKKSFRHEYEFVLVDDEGNELEVDPDEATPAAEKRTAQGARRGGRAGRTVTPPSWNRVVKRGAVFAPFMFLTITLLDSRLTVTARLFQTVLLLAFFVPFSYAMDSLAYRAFIKRGGVPAQPRKKPS